MDDGRQIAELKAQLGLFAPSGFGDNATFEYNDDNSEFIFTGLGGFAARFTLREDDLPDTFISLASYGFIQVNNDQGSFVLSKTDSTRLFGADRNGVRIGVTTVPADDALVASELLLWFDDTNGAAKLKVKAKQADGTVKTASVALA
jgi:hypothetical protein